MSKSKRKRTTVKVDVEYMEHLFKLLDKTHGSKDVYEVLYEVRGCLMDIIDELCGGEFYE